MVALNDGANHRYWRRIDARPVRHDLALHWIVGGKAIPERCALRPGNMHGVLEPVQLATRTILTHAFPRADAASAMPEAEGIKCTIMLPSTTTGSAARRTRAACSLLSG